MRALLFLGWIALGSCSVLPERAGERGQITWIAHRGRSAVAPENTLAAVREAMALRPQPAFVEVDVQLSSDGQMVVIHDKTLDRTTNWTGPVSDLPLSELSAVDAGFQSQFGETFRGEPLPSLEQVLELVSQTTSMGVMIEIKASTAGRPAAELVARRSELDRHVIASFHAEVIEDARAAAAGARTLFLVSEAGPRDAAEARRLGASWLGAGKDHIDEALVEATDKLGLVLWAWTVNDPEQAKHLIGLGVEGIITDDPALHRPAAR